MRPGYVNGLQGAMRYKLIYKRIFAWILIAGFILLIANILFIGFQRFLSAIIYIVVAGIFIITMNRRKSRDQD